MRARRWRSLTDAAATGLVRDAGRCLRLFQHAVDGPHGRRGGGTPRLAMAPDAAPGGPRANAAALAGVRCGTPPYDVEYRVRRTDGEYRW